MAVKSTVAFLEEITGPAKDAGFQMDPFVVSDVDSLIAVWMGDMSLEHALGAERVVLHGARRLIRRFRSWFALSVFAGVERPAVQER